VFVRRREFDWDGIRVYYEAGHTLAECKARFGFSNGAWSAAVARGDIVSRGRASGRRSHDTRNAVKPLLEAGFSRAEVARRLGISRPTVTYHAMRLGFESDSGPARRYDWAEVQRYYNAGNSITGCQRRFGFTRKTFADAVRRGAIVSRPQAAPIATYLTEGKRQHRGNLKRRLLGEGLKHARCEECGISEWRGRALSLELHHVNGDGRDNRLENLQLLCPNCHRQTENFGVRNVARLPVRLNGTNPDA
jgi:5-methylcytosine-specific restriction endonuclease McrA